MSRVEVLRKYISKAEKYVVEDPEVATTQLRKFWEVMVSILGDDHGTKERKMHEMHQTYSDLRQYYIYPGADGYDRRHYQYLLWLQEMGNYSTHDQGGIEPLKEDAEYCLWIARQLLSWRFPEVDEVVVQIDLNHDFIREISDAVPCQLCEQKIGEFCIKKDGSPVAKNCEHTVRKRAYAKYRREKQKQYPHTLVQYMHEMAGELCPSGILGKEISLDEIIAWFDDQFPAYTTRAVEQHTYMMTTNLRTRESHRPNAIDCNLFFRVDKGRFRRYIPNQDPEPIKFGTKLD